MKKPSRRQATDDEKLLALAREVEELLPDPSLPPEWSHPDAPEILAADLGDYVPLRRRHPMIARHFNPPPPPTRGKYVRKLKDRPDAIIGAAADVPRVRVILKEIYGSKRPPFNASKVAAAIWGADEDELEAYLKKSGKHKLRST